MAKPWRRAPPPRDLGTMGWGRLLEWKAWDRGCQPAAGGPAHEQQEHQQHGEALEGHSGMCHGTFIWMLVARLVITMAPQKLIWPHGST